MTFNISVNTHEQFHHICEQLSFFGKPGCERIQIAKTDLGYIPQTTGVPSFIERILAFFGFKKSCLRLHEVAHFSLNWLRAYALQYHESFFQEVPLLQRLRPFMNKAKIAHEFDQLIDTTGKVSALYKKSTSPVPSVPPQAISHKDCQTDELLSSGIQDFSFHWPADLPLAETTLSQIKNILAIFLSYPGTTIERPKKSTNVTLYIPMKGKQTFNLPYKTDFYLEGAVFRRCIIVKTKAVIGKGMERRALRAFDVLSGEELVSKPFINIIEKNIVTALMPTPGFAPCIKIRAKRFYEKKCQSLSSCFSKTAEIRYKLMSGLISALARLHDLTITNASYRTNPSIDSAEEKVPSFPAYHGDIKPENLMVYLDDKGILQGVLSDLSSSGKFTISSYTPFFRSPEKIRFLEEKLYSSTGVSIKEIIDNNASGGQAADIWSLGIVFLSILSGGRLLEGFKSAHGIPDFLCFATSIVHHNLDPANERLSIAGKRVPPQDTLLGKLPQTTIDDSINELAKQSTSASELQKMWLLVRRMLQVDPGLRITAKDAEEFLASS